MNPFRWLLFLFILFFGVAGPVSATLIPLAEDELAGIRGGFGFSVPADQTIGLKMAVGTLYYLDADGVAPFFQGGYLSFCGISMRGSITTGASMSVDSGAFRSMVDNSLVAGMVFFIDGMTIRIDSFSIDAIRVGSEPGTGPSFGAIGIQNFVMELAGKIQIYAH